MQRVFLPLGFPLFEGFLLVSAALSSLPCVAELQCSIYIVIGLSFFLWPQSWDRTIETPSLPPEAPEELSADYNENSTPTPDINNENRPEKFKLDFAGQLVFITLAILSLMVTLDFQSIRLP